MNNSQNTKMIILLEKQIVLLKEIIDSQRDRINNIEDFLTRLK